MEEKALLDRVFQKIKAYRVRPEHAELLQHTPIMFLVGVSGAGKDSVKQCLLEQYPDQYHHVVSHTTRAPRVNQGEPEHDGVDYHFIDFATVERLLDNHGYIEANRYSGHIYGTSVAEFQLAHDEGKIAITDLEVQGVAEYMVLSPRVKPVFIVPPDYDTWMERYLRRYGDAVEKHRENIRQRLLTACRELEHLLATDYFYIVVNRELKDTVHHVNAIAHDDHDQIERRPDDAVKVVEGLLDRLQVEVSS